MTGGGWHPVWRKLYEVDHWLAPTEDAPASRRDAWVDLCQMATYQPRRVGGTLISLERGELVGSVRTFAGRWKWSKSRVHRFLSELDGQEMLKTVSGTRDGTVYRVVNYETYAIPWDSERDSERDSGRGVGTPPSPEPWDRRGTDVGQEQESKILNPPVVPPGVERDRKGPATRLPEDWEPNGAHEAKAKALGLSLADEVEGFRLHAEANDRRQVMWDASFHAWLKKSVEFHGPKNGRPPPALDRQNIQGWRAPEA